MTAPPTRSTLLDPTYRMRAIPTGGARYWSWLFAAPAARGGLLAVYALGAEWRALYSSSGEPGVARLKLAWWREEIERLIGGEPLHPLSLYLDALPGARSVDFAALAAAVDAADAELGGVPLETGGELEAHAGALWGGLLAVASQLTEAQLAGGIVTRRRDSTDPSSSAAPAGLDGCIRALAAGAYLAGAVLDYRRPSRLGRVPFPVDELLASGIENEDLCADIAPPRLEEYLDTLRARARGYFRAAQNSLSAAQRSGHRHLLVLAALGLARLADERVRSDGAILGREAPSSFGHRRLKDMLIAWKTARGAQR